ncbi:membrane-bound ClpP family serine protease [Clostridium algifaecis]|uniref:Membrane-bound ClpP family serine protease n=1 Tax=Clostridium algifaecis TaxID=1472040 RepID=A0ABS4KQ99_9CLOT|nr:membrane-bound ClpP family serine protease [Clostridium algifaecis]
MSFSIIVLFLILGFVIFLLGLKTKNYHMITSGGVILLFFIIISINIYIPNIINNLNK